MECRQVVMAEDKRVTRCKRCASAAWMQRRIEAGTEAQSHQERRDRAGLRLRAATGTGRESKLRAEGGKSVAKSTVVLSASNLGAVADARVVA